MKITICILQIENIFIQTGDLTLCRKGRRRSVGRVAGGTGFRVKWRAVMVISKDERFEWDEEKDELNKKKYGFGFLVFYTERNGRIRLFSARLGDKRDREVYFGNCRNNDTATNIRNS
jgi:hypothetical protein